MHPTDPVAVTNAPYQQPLCTRMRKGNMALTEIDDLDEMVDVFSPDEHGITAGGAQNDRLGNASWLTWAL